MITSLLRLATRNVLRNRRRTLITAASVAFSVWLSVIFVGTRRSTYERLIDAGARAGLGELTVIPRGALDGGALDGGALDGGALDGGALDGGALDGGAVGGSARRVGVTAARALLAKVGDIRAVLPRIAARAILATSVKSTGAALLGIDPVYERDHVNLMLASMRAGAPLTADDDRGCLVGTTLAKQLELELGGKLVYTVADASGEMVSQVAFLRGTFETGNGELDAHTLLLPIDTLRGVLGYAADEASYVAGYRTDHDGFVPPVQTADSLLVDWRRTLPDLASFIRMDAAMYRVLLLFVGAIVASGILNTMMLSVLERRRELGVMLAIGMTPSQLVTLVVLEASLVAGAGLAIGAISVAPLYVYLNRVGIDLSQLLGQKLDAGGVAVDLLIGCRLTPGDASMIAATLALLTMAAAAFPAVRAATTNAIESVREA